MENNVDWRLVILQRWAGEFPPAKENENYILKSSQEIADDLRNAGEFLADEVSMFLATQGYRVVFDGGYPYWAVYYGIQDNLIDK